FGVEVALVEQVLAEGIDVVGTQTTHVAGIEAAKQHLGIALYNLGLLDHTVDERRSECLRIEHGGPVDWAAAADAIGAKRGVEDVRAGAGTLEHVGGHVVPAEL